MAHDTSGPAFPCPTPAPNGNGDLIYTDAPGMTLRDWFAGQALAGIAANRVIYAHVPLREHATMAYVIADAMLAARQPKAGEV